MPTWPSSLPIEPNNGKAKETVPDTVIREQMDSGPPILRRRDTTAPRKLSLPYRFTPAQTDAFDSFLMNDLQGGSLPFTFYWPPAPRATQTVQVQLAAIPAYEHQGGGVYDVTLELEILP